ncbi:MAG: hypothetical protein FWE13_05830 [Firmicutes bacterium]|nr:hypothetical protein [Bacillota bacterium]
MENREKTKKIFGLVSFILGLLSTIWLAVIVISGTIFLANPSWLRPANAHCCEMTSVGNFIFSVFLISAISAFIPLAMSIAGIIFGAKQVKREKTKMSIAGIVLSCLLPLAGIVAIFGFVIIPYFVWLAR